MYCINLMLTKFVLVRYTNLFDFWFDKRERYVKRMETKLEYLLDSGTTFQYVGDSGILMILERWVIAFKNALFNIETTQNCCIGNDIFSVFLKSKKLCNCHPILCFWLIREVRQMSNTEQLATLSSWQKQPTEVVVYKEIHY